MDALPGQNALNAPNQAAWWRLFSELGRVLFLILYFPDIYNSSSYRKNHLLIVNFEFVYNMINMAMNGDNDESQYEPIAIVGMGKLWYILTA